MDTESKTSRQYRRTIGRNSAYATRGIPSSTPGPSAASRPGGIVAASSAEATRTNSSSTSAVAVTPRRRGRIVETTRSKSPSASRESRSSASPNSNRSRVPEATSSPTVGITRWVRNSTGPPTWSGRSSRRSPKLRSSTPSRTAMGPLISRMRPSAAGVALTPEGVRSNRGRPRAASRLRTCWVTAGCDRSRLLAALVNEPSRYTAANVRSQPSRTVTPLRPLPPPASGRDSGHPSMSAQGYPGPARRRGFRRVGRSGGSRRC